MSLNVGSRLGPYDVTALIGEGAMGQVYQATDTKLNRQVAPKVLPQAFTDDPDRPNSVTAKNRSWSGFWRSGGQQERWIQQATPEK